MILSLRTQRQACAIALLLGFLVIATGCEPNKAPRIETLSARPECGVIFSHTDGDYMLVEFVGTGTGGNFEGSPTGFNVPLQAEWDFGDGSARVQNTTLVRHKYTQPGSYTCTLTVTDKDGDSDSGSIDVEVFLSEDIISSPIIKISAH